MSFKINKNWFSILAIALLFIDDQIHYSINTIARILDFGLLNAVYYLFKYGIMIGFVFLIGNRIQKKYFLYCFTVLLLLGLSAIFSPDSIIYLSEDLPTILYSSLWSIFVCMHIDLDKLEETIEYSIKIAGLMMCICFPINELLINYNTPETQYMAMSYMLLTGAVGYLYYGITRMKIVDIIIGVIQVIELCIAGARGPLLCILAIVFISAIRLAQLKNYRATATLVCVGLLGLVLVINLDKFILILSHFGDNSGLNLRLIHMIQNDNFFESKSTNLRNQFQVNMKDFIWNNPLGAGIYSDRVLGGNLSIGVAYAHNIIFELLMNYGVFLGGMCVLLLLFKTLQSIFNSNTNNKATLDILVSLVLVKLFVSSSYWFEPLFFLMIFLLYKNNKDIKLHNLEREETV